MSEENSQRLLVRIVNVDYYLSKPISSLNDPCYSGFRSLPIFYLPIIRIFGPTYSGVKTCLHIHGVFPYIFVPNWSLSIAEKDLYQFAVVLDKAINTSFANSAAKTCHVYRISAVQGRPFYGFYEDEKQFLKIEFYNPAIVKRAADLLQDGAVFGTSFQPYEAHVPYILQFFIDNNLYGMNYVALSSYKLRSSEDNSGDLEYQQSITKQSYCALEIDANVDDIVDLNQTIENMPNNPGLAFIWEEEKRRRRMHNESSQITQTLSQERPPRYPTRSESYFRDKIADKLAPYKRPSTPSQHSIMESSQCSQMEDTELNTQSRSVLSLLEKLMDEKEPIRKSTSGGSSPSIVYSDDENEVAEVHVESSQPILKLQAENDSILGNQFSDNEMEDIDDLDHCELSQSFIQSRQEKVLASDDSDGEYYDRMPQLDGATSPKLTRRCVLKTDSRSKREKKLINRIQSEISGNTSASTRRYSKRKELPRTYNLRSKSTNTTTAAADGSRSSRIGGTKPSPCKFYPQLQIDTQKSPKCSSVRSKSPVKESSILAGSPSTSAQSAEAQSRLCPIDELRSSFRRPYPQLGINIKKSPRASESQEKPKPTRLRKRKINFSDQNVSASDGSFDISAVTVKWKKRRLKPVTPVDGFNNSFPVDGDISSQKYSLKIRFNANELEERMYSDMLLKRPAVLLKRISLESSAITEPTKSPAQAEAVSLVSDVAPGSVPQNFSALVQLSNSSTATENPKSEGEVLPMLVRRKRLGMRMRAQKDVEVSSSELLQKETDGVCRTNKRSTEDLFLEQSNPAAEKTFNPSSSFKDIESCNIAGNVATLGSGRFERKGQVNDKFVETSHRDSSKRLQLANRSDKLRISSRKVHLRDADENIGERGKNRRLRNSKVANRNSELPDVVEHSKPVDVVEPRLCDEEAAKPKNEENFKFMNLSVRLRAVDIDKIHAATTESSKTANWEYFETNVDSRTANLSTVDFVYSNEPLQKQFEVAKSISSDESCNQINPSIGVSKPCFSDIDDFIMINREKEIHSHITSSAQEPLEKESIIPSSRATKVNSDETCPPTPQLADISKPCFSYTDDVQKESPSNTSTDAKSADLRDADTTVKSTMSNEEIDRIALSIINRTASAFGLTGDEPIRFTEIPNLDEIPCTQELSKSIEFKESAVGSHLKGPNPDVDCTGSVSKSENFVIDDEDLVLSDEETDLGTAKVEVVVSSEEIPNHSEATSSDCSVIDATIKFTELECGEDALNDVEFEDLIRRSEKSSTRQFPSSSGAVKTDFKVCHNQSAFKPVHPSTSEVADNPRESGCVDGNNHLQTPEQQTLNSKESADTAHSQPPNRAAKSLRWAVDEFENAPSTSGQPGRSKNEGLKDTQYSSPLSTSLFASTVDPNDLGSPAANPHLLNRPLTQELFSPSSPTKISQSSNEDAQIFSGSSNSSTKDHPEACSYPKQSAGTCSTKTQSVSRVSYNFNNSIWYSSDEEADENQVCSLYQNETVSSPEIVLFPEGHPDSPTGADPVAGLNEKSLSQRTNNSGSDVLLSSPPLDSVSPMSKDFGVDDSPTGVEGFSRRILHSTPSGRRTKKSPSPSYTPIYKKLMLKRMNEDEKYSRRELKMDEIKEEAEVKALDSSASLVNNSVSKSENGDASRSHDGSHAAISVGSGRIDATMNDTFGFKIDLEDLQSVKADVQFQYITVISMELFVETRLDLNPDPEFDPISCIIYTVFHDAPNSQELKSGMIIVNTEPYELDLFKYSCQKEFVQNEDELFDLFVKVIRHYDPDMFLGYEIEMLSWGYFIQRGQHKNRNCYLELSRVKDTKAKEFKDKSIVEDGDYSNELKLVGRIVLNVWRIMRHEIALQSYTFENILFHIMHQRAPQYSFRSLTQLWKNSLKRWMVVEYFLFRAECNILILQQLDFFGRTSELAKLFGIQFYEVLSRGSQFRVESMMLRLAKTKNFVAMSPNPKQRSTMKAPECLPLIMEPESDYYKEPVIVLDFQSLYPSIIIAYNYCFSTCLGRVQHLVNNETFEFGCAQHTVPIDLLLKLESSLNISPCGVAFVDKNVRRGILPTMLEEILETRLMVKKSMKQNKNNSVLQRVLHARQLGLKLIANVTYGYTSANFSGRMPCIEIGDSVVSKGRETLERAVRLISTNENWRAKVIYGDTDSLFVMVPGRTKEEAFRIGVEIVDAVTNENPKPVKLKLEKVYYPCILQTKKRYVGYMYESADQKEPVYDAKGIETVRRDGCPAVAKILEKSLRLLFETNDVDTVKRYVQHQFTKIISGRLSIQELTFAREYRGMANYKPAACVPALQLARQALLRDKRAEPRIKERVRYVLTAGPPNVPLIRLVRTPEQFLSSPGSLINAEYYITRAIIPALERCFALIGVNTNFWYIELPRKKQLLLPVQSNMQNQQKKKTAIFQYFASSKCISCSEVTVSSVCKRCEQNPQQLAIVLGNLINAWQQKHDYISKICQSCSTCNEQNECVSLDCPTYYTRCKAIRDVEQVPFVEELQHKHLRLIGNQAKAKRLRK